MAEKTVTWADESQDTISVSSKGVVTLNGEEIQPFGFCFFGWLGIGEITLGKILDWMDAKGVRFVDIYFLTSGGGLPDKVDFYFPKFYDHKKFVRVIIAPNQYETFTEYDEWETRFDAVVNQICTNSEWANMVYAVEITHEAGFQAKGQGLTVQQLSDWLDTYNSHASTKLSSSSIGLIPICHADSVWANPSDPTYRDYWKKVMEKTDVIWFDAYPVSVAQLNLNLGEYRTLAAQVGKDPESGYKFWYEFGRHMDINGVTPQYIPVDYLTTLLAQPDTGDIFLFYVYEAWDGSPEYPTWYFDDTDGSPEAWTIALAPYFPAYGNDGGNSEETYQIEAGADDAYMNNSTPVHDHIITYVAQSDGDRSAWRWALTNIPKNATILSAVPSFYTRTAEDGGDVIRFQIFDQDNCNDFDEDFRAWALMVGFYDQTMPVTVVDEWINMDDITALVQAFVNREGYVEGNYMGLVAIRQSGWDSQGVDTYESEVEHDTAAKITITWEEEEDGAVVSRVCREDIFR